MSDQEFAELKAKYDRLQAVWQRHYLLSIEAMKELAPVADEFRIAALRRELLAEIKAEGETKT